MMTRDPYFVLIVAMMKRGKSTLALNEFVSPDNRRLIFPASRSLPAFAGVPEIDWSEILENSTGLMPHQAAKFTEDHENYQRFAYELGRVLNDFEGDRVIHIDSHFQAQVVRAATDKIWGFRNGTVIFDDFKNYIPSNGLPFWVQPMLTNMRSLRVDYIFLCHSFGDLPPKFLSLNPDLILGPTSAALSRSADKMPDGWFDVLEPMKARIDAISARGFETGNDSEKYYFELLPGVR